MKSLLLIRHAKSSWDFNVDDFDRPLNHRGETDAPAMAQRLIEKGIKIDAFLASPAKRAFTTAQYFAKAYNAAGNLVTIPSLYEPTMQAFQNAVASLNYEAQTVAVFAHNPGITHFANSLTNTQIDDMPTCSIFAVKAAAESWSDFATAEKEFWFFEYPKNA